MLKKLLDLKMAVDKRDLELAFFNDTANRSGAFALCRLNGDLVVSDKAFERVLATKDGLVLIKNRIQPLDSNSRQVWHQQWSLATERADSKATPKPFNIKSGKLSPLIAEILFYKHKQGTVSTDSKFILIRLQGASKEHPLPSVDVLIEAFSFSQAEANVALLLCEGLSPTQIAERRQTSLVTVRNQIRSILTKVHVSSVPQLIALIFNLSC